MLSEPARQGVVPTGTIPVSPLVVPYLQPNVMPLPNAGTLVGGLTGRYVFQFKQPPQEDYGMGRVDYTLSEKDSLFVRYTNDRSTSTAPDSQGTSPFFYQLNDFRVQHGVVGYTRIVNASTVNDLRLGTKRSLPGAFPGVDPQFPQQSLTFIPGRTFGRIEFTTVAAVGLASAAAISAFGQAATTPGSWFQTGYQVSDHLGYTRGSHTFKVGAQYELLRDNVYQVSSNFGGATGGTFRFNGAEGFLAGTPVFFTAPLPTQDIGRDIIQHVAGFYAIDDVRLTPRLTLNLGLRHELITSPRDRRPGHTAALVNPLQDPETTLTPNYFPLPLNNFAPRVGFAWDIAGDGKTSLRSGFGMYYNLLTGRDFELQVQFPPVLRGVVTVQPPVRTPVFPNEYAIQQALGFPVATSRPSGRTQAYSGMNTPTVLQYSVEIQRQLSSSAMLRVGYIGSRGYHLISTYHLNTRVPTILPDGQIFFAANAPLQNPNLFSLEWHGTEAQSWYNSLQTDFRLKPTRGLELQTNYVWSRNIDNGSGNAPADQLGTPQIFQNPFDHNADKSLSALDARHHFALNYLYEFPAASLRGVAGHVVNGWSLGGILTLATGNPFTAVAGFCRSNVVPNCSVDRPNLAPGANHNPVLGGPDRYFDPTAFVLQPSGFLGNLGRNTLIGPGLASFDFSLYKRFHITENKKLQFRTELFNLFNRPNFGLPGSNIFTPTGAYAGNAGVITRTVTTGREVQFGLRFSF